ncbi:hypothetical protein MMC28_008762 [Mycoblastus sanguinarius]|nr:hypothetical protein [Mycoblastus sanguinarius]
MPSPPRRKRDSPPKRAALHERSDSHTNERVSPTLRMVGDPEAQIYGSSPFPTKPSQILSPKGYNGSTFGAELGVPHGRNTPSETKQENGGPSTVATSVKEKEIADIERDDDAPITQKSSTYISSYASTSGTMPGLDTSTSILAGDQGLEDNGRVSDDIVQLPSVPTRAEISGQYSISNQREVSPHQAIVSKDSDTSLSSTNSTGTVIIRPKNRNGPKRVSYSAFPSTIRPGSSKSNLSLSTPEKPTVKDIGGETSLVSPISPSSPMSSGTPVEHRTSSGPMSANLQAASQSLVNLQYPVIRPPSASASWAEMPTSVRRTLRTVERDPDRWNPHLSTVQSEGTSSEGRSSQNMWLPDSSRVSKSSSIAINPRESSELPPMPSSPPQGSLDLFPLPIPPPVYRRDITGSTIRVVNEREDDVPSILPTIPGSRGSEYLAAPSTDNRASVVTKRGSRASFFRDSIPAWARAYYARPASATSAPKPGHETRPSTSTENISLNVFRPRTRPEPNGQERRSSLVISPVRPRELDLAEVRVPPRRRISPNWSPHLWHDRTSLGRRRTIFQAPSLDEQAEGNELSKRSAQILLFVIGFIFPPAWFIAAVLPLPPRPEIGSAKGKDAIRRTQIVEDLEKQLGPIDEARYENARWWRNINRIMSVVGILIIIAIIALAVVAAK